MLVRFAIVLNASGKWKGERREEREKFEERSLKFELEEIREKMNQRGDSWGESLRFWIRKLAYGENTWTRIDLVKLEIHKQRSTI